MNIPVDPSAPVRARATTEISAPLDAVWRVLTDIEDWPRWQNDVTEALVVGEVREGAVFKWKAGGIGFTSGLHTVVPKRMFGWTGRTFGVSAIHNWSFEERDGTTVATVEESLDGILPRLLRGFAQRTLDTGIQKNLQELKAAAEAAA